jgi:hypothetical protein
MHGEWKYEDEWFEENNITEKIKNYLVLNGYEIIKYNKDKREKGHDIEAKKDGIHYIIEVKGYPSDKYVSGNKKGSAKRTDPRLQAKHWFAEALLSLLLAKARNMNIKIILGFPRFPRYHKLLEEISPVAKKLDLGCIFVAENGLVTEE